MSDVMTLSAPWWSFLLRGALTYLGLLVLMRLAGKRSFGEMSAFNVVVIALAGGTLRTAIIGDDQGMLGPFLGVAGILLTDKGIAWASTRATWVNRLVEGFPALLVRDGTRDCAALRRQGVPEAALDRALHAAGLEDEREVAIGRLEPNGKITLVRRSR
ncbi:MAG TPA: YetF domain-containing protein [Luteibacter sp.]|jgi:uncharacterized membrane protein YcaP (DUF421 family)|uniref:DUF421 domain-containing protein n=1 Tax=Luteibacter sp. TaxID=1886636 RepID=UPI002F425528